MKTLILITAAGLVAGLNAPASTAVQADRPQYLTRAEVEASLALEGAIRATSQAVQFRRDEDGQVSELIFIGEAEVVVALCADDAWERYAIRAETSRVDRSAGEIVFTGPRIEVDLETPITLDLGPTPVPETEVP